MGFIIMTNVYQWVLVAHVKFVKFFPVHYNGWNLPVTALGTKPKVFERGVFKRTAILLFRDSLANFSNTLSGFFSADLWFFALPKLR
jgi:hypothetical protein